MRFRHLSPSNPKRKSKRRIAQFSPRSLPSLPAPSRVFLRYQTDLTWNVAVEGPALDQVDRIGEFSLRSGKKRNALRAEPPPSPHLPSLTGQSKAFKLRRLVIDVLSFSLLKGRPDADPIVLRLSTFLLVFLSSRCSFFFEE